MNSASELFDPALDAVQFIDHRSISWSNIRQTDYWLHKRFQYTYPGPVHELRQRLLVVPPEQYGDQRLRAYAGRIVGAEGTESNSIDDFGNRVLSFYIPEVPFDPNPMDFHAWFEAYVGGEWRTFDARHNRPRIAKRTPRFADNKEATVKVNGGAWEVT